MSKKIERKILRPVKLTWRCECGGKMQQNGFTGMSNPPVYGHSCTECGRSESLRGEKFPRIDFEEIPVEAVTCKKFYIQGDTTSATKCKFCGKEEWEHEKS